MVGDKDFIFVPVGEHFLSEMTTYRCEYDRWVGYKETRRAFCQLEISDEIVDAPELLGEVLDYALEQEPFEGEVDYSVWLESEK